MCLFYLTGTTGTSSNSSVQRDKVQLCSANTSSVHGNIIRGRRASLSQLGKNCSVRQGAGLRALQVTWLYKRDVMTEIFCPGSKRFQKIHNWHNWQRNYADSAMRITPHRVCAWCLGTHGKRTLQCPNHQQIHAIDPKSWSRGVKRKPLLAAISP